MPATTASVDWTQSGPVSVAQSKAIGERLCARVRSRTQAGRDAHSFPFEPYSAAYARRKGVDPSAVDLTATGKMLAELRVIEATPTSVTIGIDGDRAIVAAAQNSGTETLPRRHFLDVNGSDEEDVLLQVLRYQAANFLSGKKEMR